MIGRLELAQRLVDQAALAEPPVGEEEDAASLSEFVRNRATSSSRSAKSSPVTMVPAWNGFSTA
jgi:hypothetical protein